MRNLRSWRNWQTRLLEVLEMFLAGRTKRRRIGGGWFQLSCAGRLGNANLFLTVRFRTR